MIYKDKIVWITGASSGIGEALAYLLAERGAKIIISSRNIQQLELVKKNCAGPRENIEVLPLDLVKWRELKSVATAAADIFGGIDILINNGGVTQRSLAVETELSVDEFIMNVDYFGHIAITKAVLPMMIEKKSGVIVVVSSIMGLMSTPMRSAYCAAKHALHGFFDALRSEVYDHNIQVTMIAPAAVKTRVSFNAVEGDGSLHGKMDAHQEKGISSEECAEVILDSIDAGAEEVLVGNYLKYAVLLKRYAPGLYSKIIRKAKVT